MKNLKFYLISSIALVAILYGVRTNIEVKKLEERLKIVEEAQKIRVIPLVQNDFQK